MIKREGKIRKRTKKKGEKYEWKIKWENERKSIGVKKNLIEGSR